MRSKAKGVLGRMFGSNSNPRDRQSVSLTSRSFTYMSQPTSSPASISSPRNDNRAFPRPPVPPVPAAYAAQVDARRKVSSPAGDVFGSPVNVTMPKGTPKGVVEGRLASPVPTPEGSGRASATPTEKARRRVSGASMLSLDKPLPAIRPEADAGPSTAPRRSVSSSMHVRQPASTVHDESPPRQAISTVPESSLPISPSPARALAMKTFTDDVNGMLDGFGQTDPAKELGLPPESLRQKSRNNSIKRFPVDLGRSVSAEPPRGEGKMLSPGTVPLPGQRTSSLPLISAGKEFEHAPGHVNGVRSASSPQPPAEGSLSVQPQSISRTSSSSSRRRTRTGELHDRSTTPLGSPLLASGDRDFLPSLLHKEDSTIRSRGTMQLEPPLPLPPLSPQSIRLVTSARPETPSQNGDTPLTVTSDQIVKSSFGTQGNGPWGKQSPSRSNSGVEDEEKGRRLACEFLEGDERSVQGDKVAEFLGGP
jgi:PH/SEC7 domain-containing protein